MTDPQKDTKRAIAAARLIIDGRNPSASMGEILTLAASRTYPT